MMFFLFPVCSPIPRIEFHRILKKHRFSHVENCIEEWPENIQLMLGQFLISSIFSAVTVKDPNGYENDIFHSFVI